MAKRASKRPTPVIANRLRQCRRHMKKEGVAAYLITNRADHRYLIGFTGEDSAILVTPREVHILSDGRFDESIRQECPWARKWLRKGMLVDEIAKACGHLKVTKLAVQAEHMTVKDHATLKRKVGGVRLTPAAPIIERMRKIKHDDELKTMRRALRIAEEAFRAMLSTIRVGQTELEIAARLEYEMKRRGASGPSFPTICAEGPNAALPHAHPGRRKVRRGSAVLIDWGARVGGYCSDLTRMVFIAKIPPAIADIYSIVLEAQRRAIAAIKPGRRMCDIDTIARDYIISSGHGEAFNHGLGHGLGLDVHEPPSLSWRSDEKLAAGMVVTVEPGIYLPGVGGVRIEDDVLVTPKGRRVLSRLDRELSDAVIRARA